MGKHYFSNAYFYVCPKCKKHNVGMKYFAVFEKAEIGVASGVGLLTYCCSHCKAHHSSASVLVNGEVTEVREVEARSNGVDFESKG
jgi:hypothetical protein